MPYYRVTMYMGQAEQGWSESHWTRSALSASEMVDRVTNLCALRAGLMFTNQFFSGVRIVDEGNDPFTNPVLGKGVAYRPGTWEYPGANDLIEVPSAGLLPITPVTRRPDQIRAALQLRVSYEGPRSTTQYLAGISDQISDTEPHTYDPGADQDWQKKLAPLLTELTLHWGLKARVIGGAAPLMTIQGWVQQQSAPGLVGFAVSSSDYPTYTTKDLLAVRGTRMRERQQKTLNGKYHVQSVNTSLIPGAVVYFLEGTEGQSPTKIKNRGKAQVVRYAIYPYTSVVPKGVGVHKRGRAFLGYRGKRKVYPSLDP